MHPAHRSLPARPSLAQLKHQAKDLRLAARERDPQALAALRRLRRFADANDEQIASADVALSEAQYALAMEYGFASWSAMKHHVEALRGKPTLGPAAVRNADGLVIVDGFQRAAWGGATRRQNSVIAVFALISEAFGDEADYDWLMGTSAAAFRVQMSLGELCPSSPHANCGLPCRGRAIRAWGRDVLEIDTGDERADAREAARERIIASIDRGIPATFDAEECSLIVGYSPQGLIVRKYSARADGYEPMEHWPWAVGIVSTQRAKVDPLSLVCESLQSAIDWWNTPACDRYACGAAAYDNWIGQLRDDEAFAAMDQPKLFSTALGNAFTFDALADARGAAGNYLAGLADMIDDPSSQVHARAASSEYAKLERLLRDNRSMAPYPWELPQLGDWSTQMRHREAEFLTTVKASDAGAIARVRELHAMLRTSAT